MANQWTSTNHVWKRSPTGRRMFDEFRCLNCGKTMELPYHEKPMREPCPAMVKP